MGTIYNMIIIPRSLTYSLAIHLCLLAVLIFTLLPDSKKETRKSLKLQMISLSPSPATLSKPTIAQPTVPTKPIPVQKTKPLTPATVSIKAIKPLLPAPVTIPIQTPSTPVVQTIAPVETPKAVHVPTPQPQVQSVNIEKEFLDAHLGKIRALLIQNLKYPRNAQRLKMQGEVRVSFRLKSDGSVENIEVVQSSGFEILDEDAKTLIKNTAPQFPKPTKSITLSVPLAYLLR